MLKCKTDPKIHQNYNKTGTSKVGAISKAHKALKIVKGGVDEELNEN